jgi:hypothetical protein
VANHEAQDQEDQDKHGHQQRAEGIYKYLHPHPSGLRQEHCPSSDGPKLIQCGFRATRRLRQCDE